MRLLLEELHGAVLIPHTAVGTGQAGSYVFVVTDKNKVKQRPVRLGQPIGDNVIIESGVQAGEQVVTSGRMRLSDGATVKIVPPPTPSSGADPTIMASTPSSPHCRAAASMVRSISKARLAAPDLSALTASNQAETRTWSMWSSLSRPKCGIRRPRR